jgi:hypothetical protein
MGPMKVRFNAKLGGVYPSELLRKLEGGSNRARTPLPCVTLTSGRLLAKPGLLSTYRKNYFLYKEAVTLCIVISCA